MNSVLEISPSVLLTPRPLAGLSGKLLLLPLLPDRPASKVLPAEIWLEIFNHALEATPGTENGPTNTWVLSLATVCHCFKDVALPLFYQCIRIHKLSILEAFFQRLHSAEKKWDSIRRIPYSTPGRWVQSLDLSKIEPFSPSQALALDSILARLFHLVPFLARLVINPSISLSHRSMGALANREGVVNLRVLKGFTCLPASPYADEDKLVRLLRSCENLEELEVTGEEFPDLAEMDHTSVEEPLPMKPLRLPYLRKLSLLSMHTSPLLSCLLHTPLPSLRKLTISPYEDIPYPSSLVSQFLLTHGQTLTSLALFTIKSWPSTNHPSPSNLLNTCPNLCHLSLESPLPTLDVSANQDHPLQILTIPRPDADFLRRLERQIPLLPALQIVRTRDVRWLRKGISARALNAGVQGELRDWKRRLGSRGITVLDADWKESD